MILVVLPPVSVSISDTLLAQDELLRKIEGRTVMITLAAWRHTICDDLCHWRLFDMLVENSEKQK